MAKSIPKLCILVPCYNEDRVIRNTTAKLFKVLGSLVQKHKVQSTSFLLMVDDGSSDQTWPEILEIAASHKNICRGIKLSRNFGHQKALLAGYQESSDADCVITIDADLQDDISTIPKMIDMFSGGSEIVYGVRNDRSTDTFFKRSSANLFYRMMKALGCEIINNHADFRLMGKRSVKCLLSYPESNIFIRGLVPSLGFTQTVVKYKRHKRLEGGSKYSLLKMLSFAWEGISSLSVIPLRVVTFSGVIIALISFVVGVWNYIEIHIHKGGFGCGSVIISIIFIGGLQIFFLGIVGEYVAKIYSETKNRPRFIIEKKIG